jgi:uncharacterized protein YbjT (DUF2867 family)
MIKLFIQATVICLASLIGTTAFAEGILVFGGTGQLGSKIVEQLIRAGETDVTVFARPTSDRARLKDFDVKYVVGDATNEADVEAAFKSANFRVVINALSNYRSPGKPTFHEDTLKIQAKWSKETGVSRLIFHSSTGAGDSKALLRADLPESSRLRFLDKEKAETVIEASGMEYAILRNYSILPEPTAQTDEAFLTEDHTSGDGRVGRADIAKFTLYCLDGYLCKNKTLHVSSPVKFTSE